MKNQNITHPESTYTNPLSAIDPLALFCLSLTNVSWGNFLQKNRRDHWLSFLISQLVLVVLMLIFIFYLKIKMPPEGKYLYLLCKTIIQQSWFVFLVNLIPLPPFDLSFFYAQRPSLGLLHWVSKFGLLILLVGNFFNITKWIPQI